MNADDLFQFLLDLKNKGIKLEELPVMYMETVKGKQVAYQCTFEDVRVIDTTAANHFESPKCETQFVNALLIGWVAEIDGD